MLILIGIHAMGPRSDLPEKLPKELEVARCGNMYAYPKCEDVYVLPWTCRGKFRVGELICETSWCDGRPQEFCPRYVARRQLERLDKHGLQLMSAYECEFMMQSVHTNALTFEGNDIFSTLLFSEMEMFFSDLDKMLKAAEIDVEAYQTEYSGGQYKLALKPAKGISSADQVFRLKEAVKEIGFQNSYKVTFMSKPYPSNGNGLHFNHSLWSSNEENLLYDASKDNKLSDLASHWLGGLIKHASALAALCSPTVNCYRRLNTPWVPCVSNWGVDDRMACFRVKNLSHANTYIENRLPGGSGNPYLIMAATIAAGLDGIEKKIAIPPEMDSVASALPKTLSEALEALETDDVMVEALGKSFVSWFCIVKRQTELNKLHTSNVTNINDAEGFEHEKEMYFKFI
jgi:glutamine synthetase